MKNVTPKSNTVVLRPAQEVTIITAGSPLRASVLEALTALEHASQKCLLAGRMLLQKKAEMPHGDFQAYIQDAIPEIHYETARRWMRGWENVHKVICARMDVANLPDDGGLIIDIPDAELTPEQLKYKQMFFDLSANTTMKDAVEGVFAGGDDASRIVRAGMGQAKGGVGKQPDRKAFEKFTATKLKHITTFLTVQTKSDGTGRKQITGWRKLSPVQQTSICTAFNEFLRTAPDWLLENMADQIHAQKRLSHAERLLLQA